MPWYRKSLSLNLSLIVPVSFLLTLSSTRAYAQDGAQPPTVPPPTGTNQPMGTQPPTVPFTQPTAKTPPTPLPKKSPNTDDFGTKKVEVKPITAFNKQVPGQPQPGDPTVIHTLEEAIAVAFRRNPDILSAQEHAVRTNHVVKEIVGGRGPQVSFTGSYNRLSSTAASPITVGGLNPAQITNPFSVGLSATPPGSTPVTLSGTSEAGSSQSGGSGVTTATGASDTGSAGTAGQSRAQGIPSDATDTRATSTSTPGVAHSTPDLNQPSVRATVSQFIDITGIFRTATQLGDLEEALSRLEIERTRQDVAFNVRNDYYNLLRAQAFVSVNEAAVAESEELLRVTQAQKNAGVAAQYDVLSAQTQLENNQQALISARNQVSISRNAFANSLGVDPSTIVDPVVPPVPPVPPLDEQALIEKAIKQRPEYAEADINILVAQKNIRLARRSLEPYLNAIASGAYSPNPIVAGSDRSTAAVGLLLSIPIWDSGVTHEAIEAAKSDSRTAAVTKDQYVNGIKSEVQQSIIAIRDANERLQATQSTVDVAREALRLANVRFRAGVDTQLSVNTSQTALTQAETNAVNAEFDYLAALARLSRAVGNPE